MFTIVRYSTCPLFRNFTVYHTGVMAKWLLGHLKRLCTFKNNYLLFTHIVINNKLRPKMQFPTRLFMPLTKRQLELSKYWVNKLVCLKLVHIYMHGCLSIYIYIVIKSVTVNYINKCTWSNIPISDYDPNTKIHSLFDTQKIYLFLNRDNQCKVLMLLLTEKIKIICSYQFL